MCSFAHSFLIDVGHCSDTMPLMEILLIYGTLQRAWSFVGKLNPLPDQLFMMWGIVVSERAEKHLRPVDPLLFLKGFKRF